MYEERNQLVRVSLHCVAHEFPSTGAVALVLHKWGIMYQLEAGAFLQVPNTI